MRRLCTSLIGAWLFLFCVYIIFIFCCFSVFFVRLLFLFLKRPILLFFLITILQFCKKDKTDSSQPVAAAAGLRVSLFFFVCDARAPIDPVQLYFSELHSFFRNPIYYPLFSVSTTASPRCISVCVTYVCAALTTHVFFSHNFVRVFSYTRRNIGA